MTLFDVEQYHQPKKENYKRDWDGASYDPVWDEHKDISSIPQNEVFTDKEVLDKEGKLRESTAANDCWSPVHFGETPRKVDSSGNPTIFWDESTEPPEPDDFESLQEYLVAWQHWEENSDSSICAAGLRQEFGLPSRWTYPQEHRRATELLERDEQHSGTVSISGLVKSLVGEYFTSTQVSKKSNKKSDRWYTPLHIVDLVVRVLGKIDLDPCAYDGKHIKTAQHYTFNDDGLTKPWYGQVYMNPPYSCPGLWMKKLQSEFESGRVTEALHPTGVSAAIALVPAATDTNWLSPVLKTQPACFWKGRIKFLGEDYQPLRSARQSHVLVYWGLRSKRFKEVFEQHGFVSVPSQFLEDKLINEISSRNFEKLQFLEDKLAENISSRKMGEESQFLEDKSRDEISSRKNEEPEFLEDRLSNEISSRKNEEPEFLEDKLSNEISSRKTRRCKGDGSGCIYYRTVTKKSKEYREAYYQYELWKDGARLVKSSKYIPKRLLPQLQRLEAEKAPVKEILKLLGMVE